MELIEQKLEVIVSIKEYLDRFIPGVEDTIKLLRMSDDSKALENLDMIFEGIDWLTEAYMLTADVSGELLDIRSFNAILKEIAETLENQDYILLADLLEYELVPKLKDWSLKLIKQ